MTFQPTYASPLQDILLMIRSLWRLGLCTFIATIIELWLVFQKMQHFYTKWKYQLYEDNGVCYLTSPVNIQVDTFFVTAYYHESVTTPLKLVTNIWQGYNKISHWAYISHRTRVPWTFQITVIDRLSKSLFMLTSSETSKVRKSDSCIG